MIRFYKKSEKSVEIAKKEIEIKRKIFGTNHIEINFLLFSYGNLKLLKTIRGFNLSLNEKESFLEEIKEKMFIDLQSLRDIIVIFNNYLSENSQKFHLGYIIDKYYDFIENLKFYQRLKFYKPEEIKKIECSMNEFSLNISTINNSLIMTPTDLEKFEAHCSGVGENMF